jgi:hypothetical protein
MLNWSHFLFRQRLKHKAEELDCRVYEVSEHLHIQDVWTMWNLYIYNT